MKKKHHLPTILCHDSSRNEMGAVVPPLYQNSLFVFENWDSIDTAFDHKAESYIYSRLMNPTVQAAEEKIAAICGGEKAKLCASGMAAISSALLHFLKAGDHILTIRNLYGPTLTFIEKYLKPKFGISASYLEGVSADEFESALRPETRVVYLESPSSLKFRLQDIRAICRMARSKGIYTIIDNTWASPVFQKPLEMGVDIELHSVSKYLCGHSDVVAGVMVGSKKIVDAIILAEHELLGAKMAPFEAWLILRSMRTLHVRMARHQENALLVARHLESHKAVRKVHYPGLESFEQYRLACEQMSGSSGLLSFELKTDDVGQVKAFVNKLKLFKLGVSWGGHESLVYAPLISYLKELSPEALSQMEIAPSLVRLSVGLEHSDDLINDLDRALSVLGI